MIAWTTTAARFGVPAVTIFLLTCAGCKEAKGVDVDPLALFPAEANMAFSVRVDPLRSSAVGSLAGPLLRNDSDVKVGNDELPQVLSGIAALADEP